MRLMWKRFRYLVFCLFHRSGYAHASWLKKHRVFAEMGEDCFYQPYFIPNDAKRIRFHNNVVVAANAAFAAHDVVHHVFEHMPGNTQGGYIHYYAPIEVFDNVFIGGGSHILAGVKIGPNAVVAGGAVVNKDVPEGAIVGGNPAKVIGSFEELRKKREKEESI